MGWFWLKRQITWKPARYLLRHLRVNAAYEDAEAEKYGVDDEIADAEQPWKFHEFVWQSLGFISQLPLCSCNGPQISRHPRLRSPEGFSCLADRPAHR